MGKENKDHLLSSYEREGLKQAKAEKPVVKKLNKITITTDGTPEGTKVGIDGKRVYPSRVELKADMNSSEETYVALYFGRHSPILTVLEPQEIIQKVIKNVVPSNVDVDSVDFIKEGLEKAKKELCVVEKTASEEGFQKRPIKTSEENEALKNFLTD